MRWSGLHREVDKRVGQRPVCAASLYGFAQRYDKSLGLRVLDVCAISGAWLIAGVAAFDDRADAAALRNLVWFVGIPLSSR